VSTTPTHTALNVQVIIKRHTRCFIVCIHYRSRVCVVIESYVSRSHVCMVIRIRV